MTKISVVRRGNRRGGIFIPIEDARRWGRQAWLAYFCAVDAAKKSMAMYRKCGKNVWRKSALHELAQARECRRLCRALAGPRMVYREEMP